MNWNSLLMTQSQISQMLNEGILSIQLAVANKVVMWKACFTCQLKMQQERPAVADKTHATLAKRFRGLCKSTGVVSCIEGMVEICAKILQIMCNNFKDYAHTFCQLCAHYAHLFPVCITHNWHSTIKRTFKINSRTWSLKPDGDCRDHTWLWTDFKDYARTFCQLVSKKNKPATGNIWWILRESVFVVRIY